MENRMTTNKLKRKVTAFVLSLTMAAGMFAGGDFNEVKAETGDFTIKDGVLEKYTGDGSDVVIPEGVTEIEYAAFSKCSIKSVVIPEGVKYIDSYAFLGCENLEEIVIPSTINRIGGDSFEGTPWLENQKKKIH